MGVKHKKVKQALRLSLRNLFEQLALRTSPAAVLRQLEFSVDVDPLFIETHTFAPNPT